MVATKREFVFFTAVLSGLAACMLVTSFATTSWVTGTLYSNPTNGIGSGSLQSAISHGLFEGTFVRIITSNSQLQLNIYITCLMEHNACTWSCQPTQDARLEEAATLWTTGCVNEEAMIKSCSQFQGNITGNATADNGCPGKDQRFTNAGLWVSTVVFLSLSLLMALVCTAFSVYNAAFNPVTTILGVLGLYVWNAAGALLDLVTLVLWGAQFGSVLVHNVTYTEVITGGFSNASISLGYSYWLVMVALFLHCLNVVLLRLRQYLLDHETPPASPSKLDEYQDGVIYMY